jgi:hypothetical protein
MSLAEKQRQLIEDLNLIPDVQERLSALTTYAARMRLDPAQQVDAKTSCPAVSPASGFMVSCAMASRVSIARRIRRWSKRSPPCCAIFTAKPHPPRSSRSSPTSGSNASSPKCSPHPLNGLANVRRMIREKAAEWA